MRSCSSDPCSRKVHPRAERFQPNVCPTKCLVLKASKDGDCTASLSSLFQCFTTFIRRKFVWISYVNFLCCSFRPLLLVLFSHRKKSNLHPLSVSHTVDSYSAYEPLRNSIITKSVQKPVHRCIYFALFSVKRLSVPILQRTCKRSSGKWGSTVLN